MPPSSVLEKLRKQKKPKQREAGSMEEDAASVDRAPKSQLMRMLGSAANRTFLTSSPRASPPISAPDISPVAIQSVDLPPVESLSLDDGDDGTERVFRIGQPVAGVSVGACSTAGWQLTVDTGGSGKPVRARKANQDAYAVEAPFFGGLLCGVYDGHGAHGRAASQLVRDIVPGLMRDTLRNQMERGDVAAASGDERRKAYARAFNKAFCEAERAMREASSGIDHAFSGTTATVAWLDGRELYVAATGDSRCVLGRRVDGELRDVDLSWDQKPARADEKKRVRQAGGRVTRWKKNVGPQRVWLPDEWLPGLAMTRSVGDTVLTRYGVTPSPEVTVTRLSASEEAVVLASDGVWEFMSSDDVTALVSGARKRGCSAEDTARALVREAVRRWNEHESVVDDTTAVVMFVDGDRLEARVEAAGGGRRTMLRRKRADAGRDSRVGVPRLVASGGRLEAFEARNSAVDDDDE